MKIKSTILALLFLLLATRPTFAFNEPPEQIIIPSLSVSLPVTTVPITDETWDVSVTEVSFGDSTALPGNKGNTVIFAHAIPELFEILPNIKKGDYIHIFTENDWFVYKALDTKVVNPEDVSILKADNHHELTLYTCIGQNYEKRFVVKAALVSISPTSQN